MDYSNNSNISDSGDVVLVESKSNYDALNKRITQLEKEGKDKDQIIQQLKKNLSQKENNYKQLIDDLEKYSTLSISIIQNLQILYHYQNLVALLLIDNSQHFQLLMHCHNIQHLLYFVQGLLYLLNKNDILIHLTIKFSAAQKIGKINQYLFLQIKIMKIPAVNKVELQLSFFQLVCRHALFVGSLVGSKQRKIMKLLLCKYNKVYPTFDEFESQNSKNAYDKQINGKPKYRYVIKVGYVPETLKQRVQFIKNQSQKPFSLASKNSRNQIKSKIDKQALIWKAKRTRSRRSTENELKKKQARQNRIQVLKMQQILNHFSRLSRYQKVQRSQAEPTFKAFLLIPEELLVDLDEIYIIQNKEQFFVFQYIFLYLMQN